MGKVGSFAGITFTVSSKKNLTFKDFSRSGSSRWATHEVNSKMPIPEFIAPGQEEISFSISLSVFQGVDPHKALMTLRNFRDSGKVAPFILGTKPISTNYWYLENISESHKQFGPNGKLLTVDAEITLKEYARPTKSKKKKSSKPVTPKNISKKKPIGKIKVIVNLLNIRSSPSLKGKILKVAKNNDSFYVYESKKTDITWYSLGAGRWVSADKKHVSFKKG